MGYGVKATAACWRRYVC